MTKKHKATRDFSPMAKRIYDRVLKGVNNRGSGPSVIRDIDREIEKIKVGNPDPELKEEIQDLNSKLEAEKKVSEIVATANSQLTADIGEAKAVGAGFKDEHEKLQEEYQKVSNENDDRGLEIIHLNEKVAELESAGSGPAETTPDPNPDADPKEDSGDKAGSGDPPSQPAK